MRDLSQHVAWSLLPTLARSQCKSHVILFWQWWYFLHQTSRCLSPYLKKSPPILSWLQHKSLEVSPGWSKISSTKIMRSWPAIPVAYSEKVFISLSKSHVITSLIWWDLSQILQDLGRHFARSHYTSPEISSHCTCEITVQILGDILPRELCSLKLPSPPVSVQISWDLRPHLQRSTP